MELRRNRTLRNDRFWAARGRDGGVADWGAFLQLLDADSIQ